MAVLPFIMLAGSAISAIGAVSQANAAKAAHTYNADLRERDAIVALNQSSVEAARVRRAGAQAQGSILAGFGASGVATDEGSPLDVLAYSAANAKLDEETVLYNGRLKAMGYRETATLERYAGTVAEQQGAINAASYLTAGAGQAAYTGARLRTDYIGPTTLTR